MAYIPQDLALDVVLQEKLWQNPDLDVTLCPPRDVQLTLDGTVSVTSFVQLAVFGEGIYAPPSFDVDITLLSSVNEPPLLDVLLCKPNINESRRVGIALDSIVNVDSDINVSANEVELRYIAIDSAVAIQSDLSLSAERVTVDVSIDAICDVNLQSEIVGYYDSNVFRGAMLDIASDMQQSKIQGINRQGSFENNDSLKHDVNADWQQAKSISIDNQAQFEANIKLTTSEQVLTETARRVSVSSGHDGEYSELIGQSTSLLNESAKKVSHSNWYSFEAMLARQTERKVQGEYNYLDAIMRHNSSEYTRFVADKLGLLIETAKLPPYIGRYTYVPPPLSQTIILRKQVAAPTLPLDVTLCLPSGFIRDVLLSIDSTLQPTSHINLAINGDSTPQTGVIFVTNSVALTRTDDGREIKLLGFSVGIDSNSYTWSFSATVPLSELSKVDTAREQQIGVDFVCNGNLWRFILDDCSDSVSFGESSLTIKGKSRAMLLAHPYATQRGFKFDAAMSARQIAESELNRNGVASGFTLDWQLAGVNGWNVPANTYSYTGKTPINSLQWIAEAAGGFINADMSADILHVLAHFPTPSWEWAAQTPSIELPISLITSRSRGRANKPAYNGVTIYGENDNGIGALIKRTGTSGGYQPPMVTSDLMTDTAAAISRGKMILSDTGDIGNIGISMPLVADIGVLKPSTLIGVNDGEQWVGMVRGTTITGRLSSNRALEIDQSIDVERHFDKEVV